MSLEAALKLNRNIARQYAYFKKLFQVNIAKYYYCLYYVIH